MFYEKLGFSLGSLAVRHRFKTIALAVFLFLATLVGFRRLSFSTDYRIFFSKDDPGLSAFQKLENVFTKTDNVLFVVKAREGSVFSPGALEAVQELTALGWKLPYASRVDSLTNFRYANATDDDITYGELLPKPARALSAAELLQIRNAAVDEPLLLGSLLSKDERTAGVNVVVRLPGKRPEEVTEAVDAARRMVSEVASRHPEADIRASGMAFMNDAFMQASLRDMGVLIPIMVMVMIVAMALLLRSVVQMIPIAIVLLMSSAMTLAAAGFLGYPLTPPTVAAPMIVLTVAVADGIHIVHSVVDHLREGKTRQSAIVHAVVMNLEAVTYTWLTTVFGFLCLNYSDAPPVGHLANMTAIGVTIALLLSVTLLPALLSLLPLRAPPATRATKWNAMGRLADFVARRARLVVAGFAVITLAAGLLASRLETNDQFVNYFDPTIAFRRDVDFTMKNLSGIYRLEYQIGSNQPSGISDPAYLNHLDDFAEWLRRQPEVQHVYSIADILKRVNRVVHENDPAHYRIPSSRDAASQFLLLYEMGLPAGLDLTDRVNVDKSAARLTATVNDLSSRQMTAFTARSETWLREHTPPSMWTEATGPVVIFSQMSDRNARSMIKGDVVSLLLISICMILVLRNLGLGLLSMIPNVIPIVVGYGLWKLFVGELNVVASVAGTISLGIIVDDTIHFLTKFQYLQRKHGMTREQAMRHTLSSVGPAVFSASGILVVGFAVLILSAFQMTSHLGWLTVIVVGIAPVADLFLMPALVVVFGRDKRHAAPEFETQPAHTGAL
jgi:predicted RND superfamily exporter protein